MRKDITRTISSTIVSVVELKEIEGKFQTVESEELLSGKLTAEQAKKVLLKENKDRSIQVTNVSHHDNKYAMSKETFIANAEKVDDTDLTDVEETEQQTF